MSYTRNDQVTAIWKRSKIGSFLSCCTFLYVRQSKPSLTVTLLLFTWKPTRWQNGQTYGVGTVRFWSILEINEFILIFTKGRRLYFSHFSRLTKWWISMWLRILCIKFKIFLRIFFKTIRLVKNVCSVKLNPSVRYLNANGFSMSILNEEKCSVKR